jgi:CheY-like chemotaxis protein
MKTILIVDDDADQVEILGMVFEGRYHVLQAMSMHEAICIWKDTPKIDAIITDFFLGDGTGPTLIDTIKPEPSVVTILVTGRDLDVKVNGRYKDFDAYFIKPTNFNMLSAALSTALRTKGNK